MVTLLVVYSVIWLSSKQFYFTFQAAQDNIDLQTTILSRFDLIFIVKDVRMYSQDKVIYLLSCFSYDFSLKFVSWVAMR